MSVTCPFCNKQFKTPQGRQGHIQFVHPEEYQHSNKSIKVFLVEKGTSEMATDSCDALQARVEVIALGNPSRSPAAELVDSSPRFRRAEQLEQLKTTHIPPIMRFPICNVKQKQSS